MPIGFFVAPYKRLIDPLAPTTIRRYCAMRDAEGLILADDGAWSETEYLGDRALVKVRASAAALSSIASAPTIRRLPKDALDTSLADLTGPQKTALRNEAEDAGYTLSEIQARFGNDIGAFTLRDVARFVTQRRLKPRYDSLNDLIVLDGTIQSCRDIVDVDQRCFGDVDWARLKTIRDSLIAQWNATHVTVRISQAFTLPKWEVDAVLVLCAQAGFAFDAIKPDTFPTVTTVLDNFNRADVDPMAGNWTADPFNLGEGGFALVSNQIRSHSNLNNTEYWNPNTFGPNTEAQITFGTVGVNTHGCFLAVRIAAPVTAGADGYEFGANSGTTNIAQYFRVDNTVGTQLGGNESQVWATGDVMGVDMIVDVLKGYRKASGGAWASFPPRTDATYTAAGYVGVNCYSDVYRLDDFIGATVLSPQNTGNYSLFPKEKMRSVIK